MPKHRRVKVDKALREAVRQAGNDRCHLCSYYVMPYYGTVDHLKTNHGGGSTLLGNAAWAHKKCNEWRGCRPLTAELRAEIRRRCEREVMNGPVYRTGDRR